MKHLNSLSILMVLVVSGEIVAAGWSKEDIEKLGIVGIGTQGGAAIGHFAGHVINGWMLESVVKEAPAAKGFLNNILIKANSGHELAKTSDVGTRYIVPMCVVGGGLLGGAIAWWVKDSLMESGRKVIKYHLQTLPSQEKEKIPSPVPLDYINFSIPLLAFSLSLAYGTWKIFRS